MKKCIAYNIGSLFLIITSCSNYTQGEILGTYINNYNELSIDIVIPPESPGRQDTLVLFKDNTYTSLSFGNGEYRIFEQNGSLYLDLSRYVMPVKRSNIFNSKPILVINADASYYYEKVD